MKKQDIKDLISLIAAPAALCILGLILLLRPDSATMLIARVLGWGILLVGFGFVVALFATQRASSFFWKLAAAVVCAGVGSWLVRNPLALAEVSGRLIGILIAIDSIRRIISKNDRGWVVVAAAVGVALVFLPMTASRLVFAICGVVLMVVGAAMLFSRLHTRRLGPGEDDDPNIIDAL